MSVLRGILCWLMCWVMIATVPAPLLAADAGGAMLYAEGTTWINGTTVPNSSAVFPGDVVQTKPDSVANINAAGSSVMVLADSTVKFDSDAVSVEHGGVAVATSKKLTIRAGDVSVTPASNAWTKFEVMDANGSVQIVARQGDVSVADGQETSTLPQGQQTTIDDADKKKKKRRKAAGAIPAGTGSILDSPIAMWLGVGAVGGLVTWVLLQGDDPSSPSQMK